MVQETGAVMKADAQEVKVDERGGKEWAGRIEKIQEMRGECRPSMN